MALPQSLILFMFMFSFVVALSASAMASPAISAEIESGVLQAHRHPPDPPQRGSARQMARPGAVLALYSSSCPASRSASSTG